MSNWLKLRPLIDKMIQNNYDSLSWFIIKKKRVMSLVSLLLCENYSNLKKLGEGTFAAVFAAEDENNRTVAIKQIYVQRALVEQAQEEVNKIKKLKNNHIISYISSFYDSSEFNLNLVMELCEDSLRGQMLDRTVYTK